MPREKANYLIIAMNEPVVQVPHGVPTEVTYKEATGALEIRYAEQQLEKALHSQLKRTLFVGESLQESVAAINHTTHRAHVNYPNTYY
jgi:hypothetical protein